MHVLCVHMLQLCLCEGTGSVEIHLRVYSGSHPDWFGIRLGGVLSGEAWWCLSAYTPWPIAQPVVICLTLGPVMPLQK